MGSGEKRIIVVLLSPDVLTYLLNNISKRFKLCSFFAPMGAALHLAAPIQVPGSPVIPKMCFQLMQAVPGPGFHASTDRCVHR